MIPPWRGLGLALGAALLLLQCLLPPPLAAMPSVDSPKEGFERALAATREGSLEEALDLWTKVLEGSPRDAAACSNRGNVRLMLGDPRGAIADQNQAMAIEPDHLDPHLNRGTAEEALGLTLFDWLTVLVNLAVLVAVVIVIVVVITT